MWTREQQRQSNRKYRLAHPDKVRESVRKWRMSHPDKVREMESQYRLKHSEHGTGYSREHYLKYRDKILAQLKTPERKERAQKYYLENRSHLLEQNKKYYESHKDERAAYNKQHARLHRVRLKKHNGSIYAVNKSPYPTDEKCEYCHRISFQSLDWHHWDDKSPWDGFWVCSPCHRHIEFLLRHSSDRTKFINDFKSQLRHA